MSRSRELADFLVASGNQLELKGDAGEDGCIKKNSASGRDELQIYVGGDAYDSGSRGSGIHLYGNSDSQHSGDMAFLTGPNDNGDARIIISGHEDKTRVTIGNGIFNYVDANDDQGLLNLKGPSSQPALYIEGASATEGDITCPPADAMQFGHWDKTASSGSEFTERFRMDTSGNLKIQDGNLIIGTSGHGIDFSATANSSGTMANELLDDYEEGTWTPTLRDLSANAASGYASAVGRYTKIGNRVFAEFSLTLSNKGSMTGNYTLLSGLPFNHNGSTAGTGVVNRFSNLAVAYSNLHLEMGGSSPTVGWLTGMGGSSGTNDGYVTPAQINSNFFMQGTLIYQV